MPRVTSEKQALILLENAQKDIDNLRSGEARDAAHTRWGINMQYILRDIFGINSGLYKTFNSLTWSIRGFGVVGGREPPEYGLKRAQQEAYLKDLETARGLLQAGIDQIKRVGLENVYVEEAPFEQVGTLVELVGAIRGNLRKALHSKPEHEREVQNALETILHVLELSFKREKERIEYSGKTYQPDFSLDTLGLVIEVKLARDEKRVPVLIDEMNADLVAYQTQYPTVLFVVYDLGAIRDVDTFRQGLQQNKGVLVEVIKH